MPQEMAYREDKEGKQKTWALGKEDIHLVGNLVILQLGQVKASFHMEISSCFARTSSDSSVIAAKSKLKPSTIPNEVALTHQAAICKIFNHPLTLY
jgi:hypothetical protein